MIPLAHDTRNLCHHTHEVIGAGAVYVVRYCSRVCKAVFIGFDRIRLLLVVANKSRYPPLFRLLCIGLFLEFVACTSRTRLFNYSKYQKCL
jgi:hypothetical protein